MATSVTKSQVNAAPEQSGYWPNWGNQLCKSAMLTASSLGLGWLISRLWKGADEQPAGYAENSSQLVIYNAKQANYHWSSMDPLSVETTGEGFDSEGLFQKVGITYRSSIQERSPVAQTSHSHMLSASCLIGSLLTGGNWQYTSLTPTLFTLLALSTSQSVAASLWDPSSWGNPGDWLFPQRSIQNSMEEAGHQARITLDKANEVITAALEKVDGIQGKFVMNLGEQGKIFIHTAGEELRISAEKIKEGVQATVKIAGYEAQATIGAAGVQARATVKYIGEEVRLTIKEAGKETKKILGTAAGHADKIILNIGKQGELLINQTGAVANEALVTIFKELGITLGAASQEIKLSINEAGKEMRWTIKEATKAMNLTMNDAGDILGRERKALRQDIEDVIGRFSQETHAIIGRLGTGWRKEREVLTTELRDRIESLAKEAQKISESIPLGFVEELKDAVFGRSDYRDGLRKINSEMRFSPSSGDKVAIVGKLLKWIRSQGQESLLPSEKAYLYAELIRCVNTVDTLFIREQDRKWLFHIIAGIAYHDEKLVQSENPPSFSLNTLGISSYTSITNYFQDVVLRTLPDQETRKLFLPPINLAGSKTQCSAYLSRHPGSFSSLSNTEMCPEDNVPVRKETGLYETKDMIMPKDLITPLAVGILTILIAKRWR
jgi:hypothetical protein